MMSTEQITFTTVPPSLLHDMPSLLSQMLPYQGSIEVQNDQAGKEHAWHQHTTDETLVILNGSVRFYHDGGERVCQPGDVINLPAGIRHGSIALDDGCVYLIALERKSLVAET